MWKLLENGDELKVGDKLRHRIIFGVDDETITHEYKVIKVENIYYSAELISINGKLVPEEDQFTWSKEIAKLSDSRLQIWIKENKRIEIMNEDIRKNINKFKEFELKEVIISYDCSDIHNPFSAKLLDLLKSKYEAVIITKSNYKLKMSFLQVELKK